LTEIEHNCNSQTVGIVKRLADEYRKLRGKAQENEKKEVLMLIFRDAQEQAKSYRKNFKKRTLCIFYSIQSHK